MAFTASPYIFILGGDSIKPENIDRVRHSFTRRLGSTGLVLSRLA